MLVIFYQEIMVYLEQVERNQLIQYRCVRYSALFALSGRTLAVHIFLCTFQRSMVLFLNGLSGLTVCCAAEKRQCNILEAGECLFWSLAYGQVFMLVFTRTAGSPAGTLPGRYSFNAHPKDH